MLNRKTVWILCGIALSIAWASYVAERPMDFRVYHYGARGLMDGTRPMYGESSGLGWPLHYRYPPLFMFLFAPFALLPLEVGAAVWVLLKCALLALLVRAIWKRLGPAAGTSAWIVPILVAGPYVIEDFRYGNAQFFVFALTALALLEAEARPLRAAGALGLAVSLKVWPLFFVPYLAVRRHKKAAQWTVAFSAGWTLLPALFLGIPEMMNLLGQWTRQEFSTQLGETEIWFPNQSLRGVLMRYLTVIDYTLVPDSNYAQVHLLQLDPALVRLLWLVLIAALYAGFLYHTRQTAGSPAWAGGALAFALLPVLQPFTQKYAMVVLLWPALVAGRFTHVPAARLCMMLAAGIILLQPLIPGSSSQRLLQVLGFDFAAAVLLAVAMALCLRSLQQEAHQPMLEIRSGRIL